MIYKIKYNHLIMIKNLMNKNKKIKNNKLAIHKII